MTDTLTTHLFIEFYYKGGKGLLIEEHMLGADERKNLFEAYGLFDGCDKAANKIVDMVFGLKHVGDITIDDIGLPFVRTVHLKMSDYVLGSYRMKETVVGKDGTFDEITITVNKNIDSRNDLFIVMMHELTHAYQDYNLRRNGSSLSGEAEKIGYNKFFAPYDEETVDHDLSRLFYYLNQYERGGYMTMLAGIMDSVKDRVFENLTSAINFLKESPIYEMYRDIRDVALKYADKSQDEISKKITLSVANTVSGYDFKTFGDLSSWLLKNSRKALDKLDKVIPKLACERMQISGFMKPITTEEIRKLTP